MTKKNHKRRVRELALKRKREKSPVWHLNEYGEWRHFNQKPPRKHGEGRRGRGLGRLK